MLRPEDIKELWQDESLTIQEICWRLDTSDFSLRKAAKAMGLARRTPGGCKRGFVDIDEAEIAARAALVRSRWTEEERIARGAGVARWELPVVSVIR
jgi:hypothetical protein